MNFKTFTIFIIFCSFYQYCFSQCTCATNPITVTNPSLNGQTGNMNNSFKPTSWNSAGSLGGGLGTSTNTIDCASILAPSCDGGPFARLISDGLNHNEGLSQTISGLNIGESYNVTFSQALVAHWARSSGQFEITFCGITLASPIISVPACVPCQTPWNTVSVGPFTASSSSELIVFSAKSLRDGSMVAGASFPLGNCSFPSQTLFTDLQLDGISICKIIPLSDQILDFNAQIIDRKNVELNWQTSSEINNDFFAIERSIDGINWYTIQNLNFEENASMPLNYSAIDHDAYSGISYYRLKLTGNNGYFEYSNIVSVNVEGLAISEVVIYPNPANNQITIKGNKTQLSEFSIYNSLGQDMTNMTKQATSNNETNLMIDMSKLTSGMYYVKTKINSNKIFKQ
ncbi:MAG: T9SS type A sorting domain-containing protein [Saprospiraceae bacterium]|nr:T9SS type A sorting domain-containing protein [Saprospiraceae bacterium]